MALPANDEHRALNPMREVPVLLVDGEPLAKVAILEFLEDQESPPCCPKTPSHGRARNSPKSSTVGFNPFRIFG